jgi:predicted secreted protein
MHLMLDAGDSISGGAVPDHLRMTVRLTLDPPLAPVIEDESNASTTLAQPIVLNASSTPDRLDRLVDWLWDLDANADEDNDGDATNDGTWGSANTIQASWDRPGTFTVTLHVRDVDGRTAMVQHDVTVTDVTSPNAAVSSLGDEQPVEDGYRLDPDAVLQLSCAASTDDHLVDTCAWSIDGASAGQNATVVASWADSGEHMVRLTVTDPSGNTDVLERRVVVVDRTLPSLSSTTVAALPTSVDAGASNVVRVEAADPVDAAATLRIHWDLNPLSDSDGNGVPDDDADLLGEEVQVSFDTAGERVVVITVFDVAGNSDRAVWTFDVEAASSSSSYGGGLLFGAAVVAVVIGTVVLLRMRGNKSTPQQRTAEAEPLSEQEQAESAKAAEMASIYGDGQANMAATQPAASAAYAPMMPAAPLDPMAQSLLGEDATTTPSDGLAGLEALVGDDFAEPAPALPNPRRCTCRRTGTHQ